MSSDTVPRWPRIDAIVREDGSGEVTIDGTFHPITTGSLEEARVEVLRRVTENAAKVGRPVRASATGPEGLWNLIVHPDGTVVPEDDELAPASSPTPQVPASSPTPQVPPASAVEPTPTSAPGPVFEGAPVADLPPRSDPAPDPDDTVRRSPGIEAAKSPGVADWVRENATDSSPGDASDSLPSGMTGSTTGSVMSPMSGPVDAVPAAGAWAAACRHRRRLRPR
ncbi:hypothetical protein [Promicromonospora aerolata]|uniref:BON domain-containing protein n=1 Tax=Promicromonospora aerolata TaxID=195749 RepID=A0ABW4V5Q9_9MICO